jgi:hypothetical protein
MSVSAHIPAEKKTREFLNSATNFVQASLGTVIEKECRRK